MALEHWKNKWILMLLAGIVIQAVAYPASWLLQMFQHNYFFEVFVVGVVSVLIQIAGFVTIMVKTADKHPSIYGQGRPFQHKLREEDEQLATRKPTFSS